MLRQRLVLGPLFPGDREVVGLVGRNTSTIFVRPTPPRVTLDITDNSVVGLELEKQHQQVTVRE